MSTPESGIEQQLPIQEAMDLLGIKKDAYGDRRKFLGIEHVKGADGKAYLSLEDFDEMERLGKYIEEHGKMDGFPSRNAGKGELAIAENAHLSEVEGNDLAAPTPEIEEPTSENDLGKQIYRAAAELKASELAMMPQVVREVANRMSLDDLPEDLKAKVQQSEEIARPNFQPGAIADKLINQFRQSREQVA